jgi:hypothetical protein
MNAHLPAESWLSSVEGLDQRPTLVARFSALFAPGRVPVLHIMHA